MTGPGNAPSPKEKTVSHAVSAVDADLVADAESAPASLDAFFADVEKRAWRMARFALNDREEALDAVQDAMLRMVRNYRHKPATEWTPLFWSILRRRIVDLQRRRKVRSIMVGWLGGGQDGHGDELPPWEPADTTNPGPLHQLEDKQAMQTLSHAVNQLPTRQREAFMLRVLEDMSVAETATAMGCSEGSVKTHLSRAMHALREPLEDWQ